MEQYSARETYGVRYLERLSRLSTRYKDQLVKDSKSKVQHIHNMLLTCLERRNSKKWPASELLAEGIEDDDSILF